MYLSKVEIKNIRSISHFTMEFSQLAGWHVIIGDNGAGKSSLLKAIALGLMGVANTSGWPEDYEDWITKGEAKAAVSLTLDLKLNKKRQKNGATITFRHKNKNSQNLVPFLSGEGGLFDIERAGNFSCAFGSYRNFKKAGSSQYLDIERINPIAAAHLSLFMEMSFSETKIWLIQLQHIKLEGGNGESYLIDTLKDFINTNNVLPAGTKLSRVTAFDVLFTTNGNIEIAIEDLSDGYRSNLAIVLEIVRQMVKVFGADNLIEKEADKAIINREGIVLIDEVDAHLHPSWQTQVGKIFTEVFPNIQFIVSSHSPLICRASEHGSIWRLALPGSSNPSGEITGKDKEKLIFGNVLDAYGTEVFGKTPVRSEQSNEKLKRLGRLNMLSAIGKISGVEETERLNLQQILSTDAPTGF